MLFMPGIINYSSPFHSQKSPSLEDKISDILPTARFYAQVRSLSLRVHIALVLLSEVEWKWDGVPSQPSLPNASGSV
jgi:hypothetical protein